MRLQHVVLCLAFTTGLSLDVLAVPQAPSGTRRVRATGPGRRRTWPLTSLAVGADGVCIGRPYVWGLALLVSWCRSCAQYSST